MMMSEKADGDVLEMFSFDDVSRCGAVVLSAVTFCKKRERGREGKARFPINESVIYLVMDKK